MENTPFWNDLYYGTRKFFSDFGRIEGRKQSSKQFLESYFSRFNNHYQPWKLQNTNYLPIHKEQTPCFSKDLYYQFNPLLLRWSKGISFLRQLHLLDQNTSFQYKSAQESRNKKESTISWAWANWMAQFQRKTFSATSIHWYSKQMRHIHDQKAFPLVNYSLSF